MFFGSSVSAQQITSSTAPQTQNPQTTQTKIIENENEVQQPSNASLLNNSNSAIKIESGKPLTTVPKPKQQTQWWKWLAGLMASTIIVLIAVSYLMGSSPGVVTEDLSSSPGSVSKPETTKKPKKRKKTATKKKNSKKSKKKR